MGAGRAIDLSPTELGDDLKGLGGKQRLPTAEYSVFKGRRSAP